MDYQKKKLLTQSVSFLQANLHLTAELLGALKSEEVLTSEEISTIQKDDTTSGKIVELVCLLKRKDNRTFSKFLHVLHTRDCESVIDLFSHKPSNKEMRPDVRVVKFLERQLGGQSVPPVTLSALATGLVLKEVHKDEVANLSDKVSQLQRSLRAKIQMGATARSNDSLVPVGGGASSPTSPPASSDGRGSVASLVVVPPPLPSVAPPDRPVSRQGGGGGGPPPQWDVPTQAEELEGLLKEKDSIIRRKNEEYEQLRRVLQDTQTDMQGVLDLNAQYLTIISQYNQLQLSVHASTAGAMPHKSVAELKHKLDEAETKVIELTGELEVVSSEYLNKEKELERLEARQSKYRELLGVAPDADDDEVEEYIQRLLADTSTHTHEIERLRDDLKKVRAGKADLAEQLLNLGREKEKIEFHLRQQELTIKKIKRQHTGREVIHKAVEYIQSQGGEERISSQIKLPSIERIGSQIGLAAKSNRSTQQFCVFCRTEYQPLKSQVCRVHFRPIRSGKWTCCRDDCHRSPGCLQLPHFYIEITVDRKVFLTDGARYMELTYLSANN